MPIEKKPEQVTLSGEEARQAIIDGVQRKLNRKIDEKTTSLALSPDDSSGNSGISITVDVLGSLKGAKTGAKRAPRKPKPTSAN